MYIPIILGTAREGRFSDRVAKFVVSEVAKASLETELLDVRDYRIVATDKTGVSLQAKKLKEKILKADGLIIVSPEYNHGYPGELKMMLDMLYDEYFYKPVGLCGVSMGGLGGARLVEQLRQVVIELHMVPIENAVYFSNVRALFDDSGAINDPSYSKRMESFLKELVFYAKTLKGARP